MVAMKPQPKKRRHALRWVLLSVGVISISGLLVYLLSPLISYDWSAGTERTYRFKGANSGYDYVITQQPANIIAGKTAQISVSVTQNGQLVSGSSVEVIAHRYCASTGFYGYGPCFATSRTVVGGKSGLINIPIDVDARYWDVVYSVEVFAGGTRASVDGGSVFDGSVDLSPVYPVWVGWLPGK